MPMDKLIEDNIDLLKEIFKHHHIDKAYLFGSVVSGRMTGDSDIDLLIRFKEYPFEGYAENMWDLEDQLYNVLKRKIDIVPEHNLRNPYFIDSVNKSRVLIYG